MAYNKNSYVKSKFLRYEAECQYEEIPPPASVSTTDDEEEEEETFDLETQYDSEDECWDCESEYPEENSDEAAHAAVAEAPTDVTFAGVRNMGRPEVRPHPIPDAPFELDRSAYPLAPAWKVPLRPQTPGPWHARSWMDVLHNRQSPLLQPVRLRGVDVPYESEIVLSSDDSDDEYDPLEMEVTSLEEARADHDHAYDIS